MIGHPLHAPTTHVPIGCLASSVIWDVLALVTGSSVYWAIAFHVTWLGLVATVPTVVTGLLELRRLRHAPAHADRAMRHASAMAIAIVAYAVSAIVRGGVAPPEGHHRLVAVACELVGLVALVIGGYLGGEMVYVHGIATPAETLQRDVADVPPARTRTGTDDV